MKRKLLIVLLGVGLLFSSCAKFPQIELDAAKAAVLDVKNGGADLYVPADYQALSDSMAKASLLADAGKAKWFPSYKDANAELVVVNKLVTEVNAKNETRKAELKAETSKLVLEVDSLVVADKALLVKAPKGKDGKAVLDAINNDINVIVATLEEVRVHLAKVELLEANSKIKAAKEKATTINAELVKATAKPVKHKHKK